MNIRVPWHILAMVAVFAAVVVAAVLELGTPTASTRTSTEIVTAANGVVQSTVTGTGNLEPGTDVEANFQTSGTLQHLYVKDGDHVAKGQLIATLDPTAAQLTVQQAESNLTSAEYNLTNAENQTATSGASGSSTSTSLENDPGVDRVRRLPSGDVDHHADHDHADDAEHHDHDRPPPRPPRGRPRPAPPRAAGVRGQRVLRIVEQRLQRLQRRLAVPAVLAAGVRGGGSRSSSGGSGSGQTSTTSAETIAANIASAQAAVDGAEATLRNAENALNETRLFAPAAGTVVNVAAVSPGDTVSAGGSGSGASPARAPGQSSGSGSATGHRRDGRQPRRLSSSSSSSSSSSGLVEIVNAGSMTMTVAFSESDISKIKVGQPANVTLEALSGVELAAHVSAISTLGTTSSGVVSYNATLTLDQHDSRVKPGMSASAAVVTGPGVGGQPTQQRGDDDGLRRPRQPAQGRQGDPDHGRRGPRRRQPHPDRQRPARRGSGAGDDHAAGAGLRHLGVVVGLHRDARRSRRPWRGAVPRGSWAAVAASAAEAADSAARRAAGSAAAADGSAPSRHRP